MPQKRENKGKRKAENNITGRFLTRKVCEILGVVQ